MHHDEFERAFIPIRNGRALSWIWLNTCRPMIPLSDSDFVAAGLDVFDMYIPGAAGDEPLRFRSIRGSTKSADVREFGTKIGVKPDRRELQWILPAGFEVLCRNAGVHRISKRRNPWKNGDCIQHIDTVELYGQVVGYVMEIEGPRDQVEAFVTPDGWLEVTRDGRFGAYTLARNGWPEGM